jgi:hypothetical protein
MSDLERATDLGADHAEDSHHGRAVQRLHSGRQVAAALGITEELTSDLYVSLREAYNYGWLTWD